MDRVAFTFKSMGHCVSRHRGRRLRPFSVIDAQTQGTLSQALLIFMFEIIFACLYIWYMYIFL